MPKTIEMEKDSIEEDPKEATKRHFKEHYEASLKAGRLQETIDRLGGDEALANAYLDYVVGGIGGYLDLDSSREAFAEAVLDKLGSVERSDEKNAVLAILFASEEISKEAAEAAKPWKG